MKSREENAKATVSEVPGGNLNEKLGGECMAGMDNLKKGLTPEEAREYGRRGGVKSGEARRERKALRECLDILLREKVSGDDGKKHTRADMISAALIEKALTGDVRAFEAIRDTVGEKPAERVMHAEVDPDAISAVERMVTGSNDAETGG